MRIINHLSILVAVPLFAGCGTTDSSLEPIASVNLPVECANAPIKPADSYRCYLYGLAVDDAFPRKPTAQEIETLAEAFLRLRKVQLSVTEPDDPRLKEELARFETLALSLTGLTMSEILPGQ